MLIIIRIEKKTDLIAARCIIKTIGASMDELFDLAKFDKYKEDNRREVKRYNRDFRTLCGKPDGTQETETDL